MRKLLLAGLGAAFIGASAMPAAHAQVNATVNTKDPATGLGVVEWEQMVSNMINADALIGDQGVLIISSMPVPVTVTCGKWTLVGPNPYKSVKGNPAEVKPFSVTYIKTREFDGYCKQGVVAHTKLGKTVIGKLTSNDGTFKNATVVLFSGTVTPQ